MSDVTATATTESKPVKKKKPAKRKAPKRKTPKHWSADHAQLVIHAHPKLVASLDRKLASLAKRLKCKPSRGAVVRALVERATKG
jgi:hypothetical protein